MLTLRPPPAATQLRLSEVVSALSYALDITEGQPEGHAVRTCIIGMRLAREIYLTPKQRSALFYALLLKDLGCSSNASRVCYLFSADDRRVKRDVKTANWTRLSGKLGYILRNAAPGGSFAARIASFMRVARAGATAAKELVELRCDRGATIARNLSMPEETAIAIRGLDEHWDGQGHPYGLAGDDIPMLSRILGLAQTAEVFHHRDGLNAALAVAKARSGTWFDPDLVKAFHSIRNDTAFWDRLHASDPLQEAMTFEPEETRLTVTEELLDSIAVGFGQVIDAKSPWTYRHSEGVADIAAGITEVMGFTPENTRLLRRAARLHDIGKLGISNLILDKPGKLDPHELALMRKHPLYTRQILERVSGFRELAPIAAAHHERLDGTGYDCGLDASKLPTEVRILSTADMFEALAAKRPYRQDLTEEQVMDILTRNLNTALDPACVEALKIFLEKTNYEPIELAA
ncbi:MAG TPA: HD domain-containing phosphohydrolase [Phycisphaerae bacterium]|nr:HD domain-containing phosphohydrolase [Phycisphaerae bacterium]